MVLDQFLMTPHLLALFYIGMSLLEQKQDVLAELKQKFVPTFVVSACRIETHKHFQSNLSLSIVIYFYFQANIGFWLPIQAINFSVVAPQFRVVYIGVCTLAWVNILCWFKRKD